VNVLKELLSAIKKTRNTAQKRRYFLDFYSIAKSLEDEIAKESYYPSRFSCFAVQDPKPREIFAPHFRDRIIHHLLVDRIEPLIDKRFIHTSFANRKGKGIHQAIQGLQPILRKKDSLYFLQIDVKNFFPSINKTILYKIFKQHIQTLPLSEKEKELSEFLARRIIFHDPTNPKPIFTGNKFLLKKIPAHKSLFNANQLRGLPIGSLSSQFFANLYLNELDQYAKHILKIKYYFRYVDDIIIIAENTAILSDCKSAIDDFLKEKLELSLHPNKTILQPTKNGINFLGYVIKKNCKLVRNRTVRSFKKRLYFFNYLLNPKDYPISNAPQMMNLAKKYREENWVPPINPDLFILSSMRATINSYYGIFCFADSYHLRKKLYEDHFRGLKKYFQPKDKTCSVMMIKKGVYL
jgi:retron-type reverse transcriptase